MKRSVCFFILMLTLIGVSVSNAASFKSSYFKSGEKDRKVVYEDATKASDTSSTTKTFNSLLDSSSTSHFSVSIGYAQNFIFKAGFWTNSIIFGGGVSLTSIPESYSTISQEDANRWEDPITDTCYSSWMFSVGTYKKLSSSTKDRGAIYLYGTLDFLNTSYHQVRYDPLHILGHEGRYSIPLEDGDNAIGITAGIILDRVLLDLSYNPRSVGMSLGIIF